MTDGSDQFEPTPEQRRAVEAPIGPVLVIAGPGAGKTYCLIARIHHLITRHGIPPERICAVTFTNKAAEEIGARLHKSLGASGEEVVGGTLHAFSLAVLRAHPEAAGLRRGFGVADEDYQRTVLRRLKVREERRGPLLTLFTRARLEQYPLTPGDRELFEAYRDTLRARNLVDFDDLIALTDRLLRQDPAVAAGERGRFDYVLVDEFQDFNLAQYGIVTQLAAEHGNLFVVGDDEQSIFSWTGADRRIFERFEADFPGAPRFVLNQNRRCSVQIFGAARRLVERNPSLFEKDIAALRDSPHDVMAFSFEDEAAEADWLVADLLEDHRHSHTPWGEYALLYRYHTVGRTLETRLVEEGIACRLARGQALLDDKVIAHVVASLRVARDPDDPVAVDALARKTLSPALLQHPAVAAAGEDLVGSLRAFALDRVKRNPTAKRDADVRAFWRFIYMVENLRAMRRAHASLESLVEELLSRPVGPIRNPLEERDDELTDPATHAGAEDLARQIEEAMDAGARIRLAPRGGTEIALLGMLRKAGVPYASRVLPRDHAEPGDLVLGDGKPPSGRWPLLLFKALQLVHGRTAHRELSDFVAFDLETTEKDVAACEIVEIAGVRVRGGEVVARFREMVGGGRPVTAGAQRVHGYSDDDRRDAPPFAEVWPRFRAFVGDDLLIAHNGQEFDVPVLRRLAAELGGADDLAFFDTLPLARALLDQRARLVDLAARFEVPLPHAHHALDDAEALAHVVGRLDALKASRGRKASQVHLLGYLGVALALDRAPSPSAEERLLQDLAVPYALGRYSDCLEFYAAELEAGAPGAAPVAEVIDRLGGERVMERLRRERTPAERYPDAVARLGTLVAGSQGASLAERIDRLLERVALSKSDAAEVDPARVNLLTLHSTKGLEFSRVYIVGVEDTQLPGRRELQDWNESEIQEARRLLYVGMTRAKDRLVLTRTERRDGRQTGGALFLGEAGLAAVAPGVAR